MKKLIRILLAFVLAISLSVIDHQKNDEHFHVHAIAPGDIVGKCPDCGRNTYRLLDVLQEPTCTAKGLGYVMCDECFYATSNYQIPALGHNYSRQVSITEPTCTEDGSRTMRCSRCSSTVTQTLAAVGHDYVETVTEPTCTENGERRFTCSRCEDSYAEALEALGHDLGEFIVIKEASCEEDGSREALCNRCGEKTVEIIEKTGHNFPEEWTIDKKPGLLSKGLRSKTCSNCGKRIEEQLPAIIKPPIFIGIVSGITAILAGAFFYLKHLRTPKIPDVIEKADPDLFEPDYETKTVVIACEDEEFIKLLKKQVYLSVTDCQYEQLAETIEENGPNVVICDVNEKDRLDELVELKKESYPDTMLGLCVSGDMLKKCREQLEQLKEEKTVYSYASLEKGRYSVLVKLIMPVLKPDLKSCESLDNIGQLADLMGIPGISTAINIYTSGRDIVETLQEEELSLSEGATIIGDIASIWGLDKLESVAGLVGDVESIRDALDKETGAYEKKEGVLAGKDIVDVISDLRD